MRSLHIAELRDSGGPSARGPWEGRALSALKLALLLGALATGSLAAEAEVPVRQVLMLQSLDRGSLVLDQFTSQFRVGLDHLVGSHVNVVQVVVGPTGFAGAPDQAVVGYIRSIFAARPAPDLIVTVAGPAATFARRHRQELFPEQPLLFTSVDQRWIRDAPLGGDESAVAVSHDFPRLIDDILRVLPETRQVFMVIGSGPIGRFWRQTLEVEFARFRDRVTFSWSDELSLAGTLERCANLPPRSAIVFLSFGSDALGGAYADEQVIAELHAAADAPLFAAQTPLLGHGIVGGTMISIGDLGHRSAEVAARILKGEAPETLRVPPQSPDALSFDWRELDRWGIPESRLPPGSEVRYRRPSLWGEYRFAVLASLAALTFQSLLIASLLYERRARRRAELESRLNLTLAADANRRETMSALTSSIGHELGQPLTAMLNNTEALRMMLRAGKATPEDSLEILTDIKAEVLLATRIIDRHRTMLRSRQLLTMPIDLHAVIRESLALVAHDMGARQVEATVDLSSSPCVIDGDPVLLQQVLLNLVKNAMDALAEAPPAERRITIRSVVGEAEVEVAVSDTGAGLPEEMLDRLFTPFVTTKSDGLGVGLTIARSIVEAHGGTIGAGGNPGGGARFTITLPRSANPELLPAQPGAAGST